MSKMVKKTGKTSMDNIEFILNRNNIDRDAFFCITEILDITMPMEILKILNYIIAFSPAQLDKFAKYIAELKIDDPFDD